MKKRKAYLPLLAGLLTFSPPAFGGLANIPPLAVINQSNGWTNLDSTLVDDEMYATCTGAAQFNQRWFRDSLPNCEFLGIDTAANHITGVVIYVKGRSSKKTGKAQLTPYFGISAGVASGPMAMGTSIVTRSYDITSQRNDNPIWGGWRWRSLDSLNIQAAVRGNGLSFYIDCVFAIIAYAPNVGGSNHYFVLTPYAVFDPETLAVPFQHTLTVHNRITGLLMDTYNGTVALSDSTGALSPLTAEVIDGTAVINFSVLDTTTTNGTSPQRTVIKISDGDTFLLTNGFQVINGLYNYWFAPIPSPQDTGTPFSVAISALNYFGDTVATYNGTGLLNAAIGTVAPDNIIFTGGLWTGNVTITGVSGVWDSLYVSSGERPAQGFSNAFYLGPMGVAGSQPENRLPRRLYLEAIQPNPAKDNAIITFALPRESRVRMEIYNIIGLKMATLADAIFPAGYHQLKWNGLDQEGRKAAAGVYLVKMSAGDFKATRRMTVLK